MSMVPLDSGQLSEGMLTELNEILNLNKFVRHLDSSSELPAEGQSHNSIGTEKEKVHQPSVIIKETDYDRRTVSLPLCSAIFYFKFFYLLTKLTITITISSLFILIC